MRNWVALTGTTPWRTAGWAQYREAVLLSTCSSSSSAFSPRLLLLLLLLFLTIDIQDLRSIAKISAPTDNNTDWSSILVYIYIYRGI